jgi:hypothetical protein
MGRQVRKDLKASRAQLVLMEQQAHKVHKVLQVPTAQQAHKDLKAFKA